MALTLAMVHPEYPEVCIGGLRGKLLKVTFDNSYASGGESLTPASVGLSEIMFVIPQPDANALEGYVVQYDYTAQTLMAFVEESAAAGGPLLEAGAVDLSTLVVRVLVLGI